MVARSLKNWTKSVKASYEKNLEVFFSKPSEGLVDNITNVIKSGKHALYIFEHKVTLLC